MKANELRESFSNFFKSNDHVKIESSSLVPHDDPTLLFANAGMNQFKAYFTGEDNPKNKRATTIQKCVRAGGKHNDLENVGFTARHHTFFEMMGNFSFGDYFKKEAISFAWSFLTKELKIPKDKLYVTVHKSDREAAKIWHEQENVPKERIFFLGDKDNFWEMGDVGPCGPCSEIFFDHGEEYSDGADTTECILADEGRYVEIWNLVFMQYEKYIEDNEVKRRSLPTPSVDTGAGLERVAAVMQGKYWNYDTDVFSPILSLLEKLSGKKYSDEKYTSNFRVIADHIRSSVMLITDGVIPSNEGRGYVLRRIIRRGIRNLEELGLSEVSFYKIIPAVFESLGKEYSQNMANASLAEKFLKLEEEKFRQTLRTGLELIKKEISLLENDTLSGKTAFKLYDTYGFPLDLTQSILEEKGLKLDVKSFNDHMLKQKESSKKKSNFAASEDSLKEFYKIKEEFGETVFKGYHELSVNSNLITSVKLDDKKTALFFKETSFYSESGGQAGDKGKIFDANSNCVGKVIDTQFIVEGLSAHICINLGELHNGSSYTLEVNRLNRILTQRHHSATHLLQAALIKTFGSHIKQAGSSVSSNRLRFDFTHPESISTEKLQEVEDLVNKQILLDLNVVAKSMSKEEATQKGAMALFGEKYGDEVRVLTMGDFSVELCGGTHVKSTGEIGLFKIVSESSLSSGIRRIEALTSKTANDYLISRSNLFSKIEREFSVKEEKVLTKLNSLISDLKESNKKIKSLEDKIQSSQSKDLFKDPLNINGKLLFNTYIEEANPKDFRSLSDKFLEQHPNDTVFIYTKNGKQLSYLLRTSSKNKDIHCSNIIKENQATVNGRGGGKPDMAQGSGEADNIEQFIKGITSTIEKL